MEDIQIINLYFERNERAIQETSLKYGTFCNCIAKNILGMQEEAEECVNDSYYAVWNKIPPTIPESFKAFLGRITRNIAISRYRTLKAKSVIQAWKYCFQSSMIVFHLRKALNKLLK